MADTKCFLSSSAPMELDPSTEPAQPHAEDNARSQLQTSFTGTPACAAAGKTLARKLRLSGYKRPSNNDNISLDPASPTSTHMVLRPSAHKRSRLHFSADGWSYDDVPLSAGLKRRASNDKKEQDDLAGLQEVPVSPTESTDEIMSPAEAATILLDIKQAYTPAQEGLAQAVQDNGGLDHTAAKAWAQQVMTKLVRINTKPATQQAEPAEPQYALTATAAMATDLDAACGSPCLSALSTATPLKPGLLAQCLDAAADPDTPTSMAYGAPNPVRAYTYENDESVFSREIKGKISQNTIAGIQTQWATTGRMLVSCGPAGHKGLAGIFTLTPAGRPVIWAPQNSSARAKLRALVAAGGGGCEVPAGYAAVEPKIFEEYAGKGRTRNWQLSIVLTDFCTVATPKSKVPNVKLGHFVRIVGIPTAKC